jgi:hypothetical protein
MGWGRRGCEGERGTVGTGGGGGGREGGREEGREAESERECVCEREVSAAAHAQNYCILNVTYYK